MTVLIASIVCTSHSLRLNPGHLFFMTINLLLIIIIIKNVTPMTAPHDVTSFPATFQIDDLTTMVLWLLLLIDNLDGF
jgi:hypothetical protein